MANQQVDPARETSAKMGEPAAIKKVFVAGSSFMGAAIAYTIASLAGAKVDCFDTVGESLKRAGAAVDESVHRLLGKALVASRRTVALEDFFGPDIGLHILDVMQDGLGVIQRTAYQLTRQVVTAGHLGRKTGKGFYEYGGAR
jgi:3-hydroxyacyl-CoA dehydrogenase